MVTGDSKETAIAIARRCGILGTSTSTQNLTGDIDLAMSRCSFDSSGDERFDLDAYSDIPLDEEYGQYALSGRQLDSIGQQNLADSVAGVKVFYRVAPRHKLALVRALQKRGEIVAMTGKSSGNRGFHLDDYVS